MSHRSNGMGRIGSIIAVLLPLALFLTGCGNTIPDMTAEQEQAVGEYAAMTLLKYDANHRSRLVDLSKILEDIPEAEPEMPKVEELEAEEPDQGGMGPVDDVTVIDRTDENAGNNVGSMEAFFELPEGVTLTYQEMQVCVSYPENGEAGSYFSLDASEGKRLLVLHYNLENQSQMGQEINLLTWEPVFQITVNESYTRTALMTMLMNDMSTYTGSIRQGESRDLVLLIEVDQELADNITSVSLNLKSGSKAYVSVL